jgi:hypothetical protein
MLQAVPQAAQGAADRGIFIFIFIVTITTTGSTNPTYPAGGQHLLGVARTPTRTLLGHGRLDL